MSSMPTTHPGVHGNTPNPYPQAIFTAPESQQSLGFINRGNQPQGGQPPFNASPGISTSQLGQVNIQMGNAAVDTTVTNFKEDGKILGAIQIIIGCMHLGFGIILGLMNVIYLGVAGFGSTAFVGGYPFWGGISFIISGSLSISASKEFSPCLIKGSLGMNIVSAIFTAVGLILLLLDMSLNGSYGQDYWALIAGKGISAMLMIFSLLEISIACATAHFARKIIANPNRSVLVIPTVYANSSLAPSRS
ncbi:membrane-spanning 4-domains subfamily A member 12-like [Tupaia chinensis]|uniref:membrane-spanning 4-domains subfamily A member 12-like n=1 Tax=Tupaia chinensis TaxID=246437 RepID=UPI0003C8E93D|nr:membrane-spanning 4-domains subfamily A member 12-like [Tupaia chinensis]